MIFLRISALTSFQKFATLFDEIWNLISSPSRREKDSFFFFLESMESLTPENDSNQLFEVKRAKKLFVGFILSEGIWLKIHFSNSTLLYPLLSKNENDANISATLSKLLSVNLSKSRIFDPPVPKDLYLSDVFDMKLFYSSGKFLS